MLFRSRCLEDCFDGTHPPGSLPAARRAADAEWRRLCAGRRSARRSRDRAVGESTRLPPGGHRAGRQARGVGRDERRSAAGRPRRRAGRARPVATHPHRGRTGRRLCAGLGARRQTARAPLGCGNVRANAGVHRYRRWPSAPAHSSQRRVGRPALVARRQAAWLAVHRQSAARHRADAAGRGRDGRDRRKGVLSTPERRRSGIRPGAAVSPADLYVYEYDWSPDGKQCVLIAAHGSGDNNWYIAAALRADAGVGRMPLDPQAGDADRRAALVARRQGDRVHRRADERRGRGRRRHLHHPRDGRQAASTCTPDLDASAKWLAWDPSSRANRLHRNHGRRQRHRAGRFGRRRQINSGTAPRRCHGEIVGSRDGQHLRR